MYIIFNLFIYYYVHFIVDIKHPKVIEFVDDKMRSAYTNFKLKLQDHYRKCDSHAQGRATLPPMDLWGDERPIKDWHWLCDILYTDPKYIVRNILFYIIVLKYNFKVIVCLV